MPLYADGKRAFIYIQMCNGEKYVEKAFKDVPTRGGHIQVSAAVA
jgi:hypothetical protein